MARGVNLSSISHLLSHLCWILVHTPAEDTASVVLGARGCTAKGLSMAKLEQQRG